MSDLVIRESDGWHEVTELVDLQGVEGDELWGAVAVRDWPIASKILWEAVKEEGEEEYFRITGEDVVQVIVVDIPDDFRGWFRRIWIKSVK